MAEELVKYISCGRVTGEPVYPDPLSSPEVVTLLVDGLCLIFKAFDRVENPQERQVLKTILIKTFLGYLEKHYGV